MTRRAGLILWVLVATFGCAVFQTATGAPQDKIIGLDGRYHCVRLDPTSGYTPAGCREQTTPTGQDLYVVADDQVETAGDLGATGHGAVLTSAQVRDLWVSQGGPYDQAAVAAAVATAESGRRPTALNVTNANGSKDFGLFQINTIHRADFEQVTGRPWADVLDPTVNTRFAVHLQHRQGWQPWVAWWSGAWRKHLGA